MRMNRSVLARLPAIVVIAWAGRVSALTAHVQIPGGTPIAGVSVTFVMSHITVYAQWIKLRALSAGDFHTLFLGQDGRLWATGYNYYGQLGDGTTVRKTAPLQVMSNVSAVSAGFFHTIILMHDGTVWTTGRNSYGGLGEGTTDDRSTPVHILP
jgi:alpha-tubulin suppressor-like RCC1 family protein